MSETLKAFKEAYKNLTPEDILKLFEFCSAYEDEPMGEPSVWDALDMADFQYVSKEDANGAASHAYIYSGIGLPTVELELVYDEPDEDGCCKLKDYKIATSTPDQKVK